MNTERDKAELLDQTIDEVLGRTEDMARATTDVVDSVSVVHNLRSAAEDIPVRAGFLSDLEARLVATPIATQPASPSQVSDRHDGAVPPAGIKGWWDRRWNARSATQNARFGRPASETSPRVAPGLGLAWAMVILLALAGTVFFVVRKSVPVQAFPPVQSIPTASPEASPTALSSRTTATPVAAAVPALPGVKVPLRQGVSISLITRPVQASVTGVNTGNCGTEMTWVLQIENSGGEPFTVNIDKSSLAMTDDTGKSYPLSGVCGGQPYSGSFAGPATINTGDVHNGYIAFQAASISTGARYFELRLSVSGVPVLLRYNLPTGLPTVLAQLPTVLAQLPALPAQVTPTRVPGSPPLSLVREGDGLRLDVYEGAARFGSDLGSPWAGSSHLLVEWYSMPVTPTGVYSYSTYLVDVAAGKLITLPVNEANRDVFPSPDGNRAVMVWQHTALHVALYDFRSGTLQTVTDSDPSVPQWAGPDAGVSEFKAGTEISVGADPVWAGNDTFALTLRLSSGAGADYGTDRALLVDIAQHKVSVLAKEGIVAGAFANGSVLVHSGRVDGPMQLFRPGAKSPMPVSSAGPWAEGWSTSPDGRQVAWFELIPQTRNGSQRLPVRCCSYDKPPAIKDIAVFDSTTGKLRRFPVSGIAFISPGISWTSGGRLRWSKDSSTLFYSTNPTKDHATLYRLPLGGQATAIVEMDKPEGLDVVAEGDDGSLYYTIIGVDCQVCVQLIRRNSDGSVEVVHANSQPIDWQVDERGRLEAIKDGGVVITGLSTGRSQQVNFPGERIDSGKLGMGLSGIGALVPVSQDGSWAAYSGSQSDAVIIGPDGRPTDRGRTLRIVRVK